MGLLSPRIHRFARVVCAVLLVGSALWLTWRSAAHWAVCAGADWTNMNTACDEAMSSFTSAPVVDLWAVLTALVAALAISRAVSSLSIGATAVAIMVLACPLLDPGFFWVGWGSADGVPGNGIWTASLVAMAGLTILAPREGAGVATAKTGGDAAAAESTASVERPV